VQAETEQSRHSGRWAGNFTDGITPRRIIARNAVIPAGLWLRSRHGTWCFLMKMLGSLTGIDREGNGRAQDRRFA
jgi:hypothetical protein